MFRALRGHDNEERRGLDLWRVPGPLFCVLIACFVVALRAVLYDGGILFGRWIPNQDMSQGLAFFATDVHNLRLEGDLAWWNPIRPPGYAQYYQSFLSPLAPTPGHITFIVWAYAVRLFAWMGIETPSEYFQYVWFNYVLLPVLTYWSLGELVRSFARRPSTVVLVVATYALSGVGLWNSSWFYFQESFTAFFLLGSFVRAVQDPSAKRLGLFALSVLVQLCSVNYWTLYNAIFLGLFMGAYGACNVRDLGRSCFAAVAVVRDSRLAQLAAVLVLATGICWVLLVLSIVREQAANYFRFGVPILAASQVQGPHTFVHELFNPGLEILHEYQPQGTPGFSQPAIFNAKYIGAALLPALILLPFLRWDAKRFWLVLLSAGLFWVCLAPPVVANIVLRIPFLNQIRHLFRFYPAHLEVAVILLAACGFDAAADGQRRLRVAAGATLSAFVLVCFGAWHFRRGLPGVSDHGGYYVRAFGIGLVSALLLFAMVATRSARVRAAAVGLLLAVTVVDLSAWFSHGSRVDREFSTEYWHVPFPFPDSTRSKLSQRFPKPDPTRNPMAGLRNAIPFSNDFWPHNRYLKAKWIAEAGAHPAIPSSLDRGRPIDFFPSIDRTSGEMLFLTHDAGETPEFEWRWREWGYNDASFHVKTRQAGWLFLMRLYDPLWKIRVDGHPETAHPADYLGQAIHVSSGEHVVELAYRPLARALYWPASALLVATAALLVAAAIRPRRERS